METKPLVKSVTFWLGVVIAILPAVVEFLQNGKFDAVAIVSLVLGVLVIVNRKISGGAQIAGIFR